MDDYYRDILLAAKAAGLRDRQVLLGLLWHAPSGDASSNPERWQSLQKLLADLDSQTAAWGTTPEPATATGPALEAGRLTLSGGQPGETSARIEKSLSGDFFQLLSVLVDRLVAESSRHDGIKSGFGGQPPELERLITEIERWLAFPAPRTGWPKIDSASAGGCNLGDLSWTEAMAPRSWEMQEAKALVQDFLSNNPDLAAELGKIQMVLFSLKNYISINPDYAGLPFTDKLVKAGQMARDFLDK
jgi:hypothetical protein